MKLSRLVARNYRSLRDESIEFGDLNLFIGANASGKSTILDALRFLHEGVRTGDFHMPVLQRGGIDNLCWKGKEAGEIEFVVNLIDETLSYEWIVRLVRNEYNFYVEEEIGKIHTQESRIPLLEANRGDGWWLSKESQNLRLNKKKTACALAAAAADASFPAREVVEFIDRWGFFDPNPFLLRRDWSGVVSEKFDTYGRNLGETLYKLEMSSPKDFEEIVTATRAVVGIPLEIETRKYEEGFYFVQKELGLRYSVHQMGVSSGTLRMLALMTALLAEPETNLIGIEEPENYVHPAALSAFVQYLLSARERTQLMVTTHSPLLLDYLDEPEAVRVVQHRGEKGTVVLPQDDPDGVRRALAASGFGLGEHYETKGFGAD